LKEIGLIPSRVRVCLPSPHKVHLAMNQAPRGNR